MSLRGLGLELGGSRRISYQLTDIPNLLYWLDGTDGSSNSMIRSSNNITTWKDKGGLGFDFTAAGAPNSPVYTANLVNGFDGVSFTRASSQSVQAANTALILSARGFTLAWAMKLTTLDTAPNSIFNIATDSGVFGFTVNMATTAGYSDLNFGSDIYTPLRATIPTSKTGWHYYTLTYAGSSPSSSASFAMTIDSAATSLISAGTIGGLQGENDFGAAPVTAYLDGATVGAALWSRQLGASEIAKVNSYFGTIVGF